MANQAESLLSSRFKILFKGTRSFSEINELVSLGNKIDSRREASPRSMTYMMKNRGPRIEPRGTPKGITSESDLWPLLLQTEISDKNRQSRTTCSYFCSREIKNRNGLTCNPDKTEEDQLCSCFQSITLPGID